MIQHMKLSPQEHQEPDKGLRNVSRSLPGIDPPEECGGGDLREKNRGGGVFALHLLWSQTEEALSVSL